VQSLNALGVDQVIQHRILSLPLYIINPSSLYTPPLYYEILISLIMIDCVVISFWSKQQEYAFIAVNYNKINLQNCNLLYSYLYRHCDFVIRWTKTVSNQFVPLLTWKLIAHNLQQNNYVLLHHTNNGISMNSFVFCFTKFGKVFPLFGMA